LARNLERPLKAFYQLHRCYPLWRKSSRAARKQAHRIGAQDH
jgi:hypothetical protein